MDIDRKTVGFDSKAALKAGSASEPHTFKSVACGNCNGHRSDISFIETATHIYFQDFTLFFYAHHAEHGRIGLYCHFVRIQRIKHFY